MLKINKIDRNPYSITCIECTFLYNVSYFRNVIKIYTFNLHYYEQQNNIVYAYFCCFSK
jgi:hypothetical protein